MSWFTRKKQVQMIKLGSHAKDIITGYTGTVIARTEWLYGCSRITLQSSALHEGKPVDPYTFDEQQIELIEERAPVVSKDSSARLGGPKPSPKRHATPGR